MNKVKLKLFIERFEAFLKKYPNEKVEMAQCSYNGCGSPACHGGWMHAIIGEKYAKPKDSLGYKTGIDLLDIFLGFKHAYDLESWADANPEIWGNENGRLMFESKCAFDEKDFYNSDIDNYITLNIILHKWKKVYERLDEESMLKKEMKSFKKEINNLT